MVRRPGAADVRARGGSAVGPAPGATSGDGREHPVLEVRGVAKTYPGGRGSEPTHAIADLTFDVHHGELLVLVGPSGCGKSTLLRCLSGLMRPSSGSVRYQGASIDDVPTSLSVVFQEYGRSLFPWMRVEPNVGLGLQGDPADRQALVTEALEHVDLLDVANHYPWQLSGGMQQRVAIARAIAARPQLLLMDEPFASVDAQTRASLESISLRLWEEYGWTMLLVTHDIDEAVFMADRVLVLSKRPSRVIDDIRIDLPRPRDQLETRALPEFQDYRRRLVSLVRSQHVDG